MTARVTPKWVEEKLQPYFKIPVDEVLARPAPIRDGVDAWAWVESGHSWDEVVSGYEKVFEEENNE